MLQTRALVLANECLNEEHWRLTLATPEIAAMIRPGQFVNLRVNSANDPLCRRPFTVFRPVNVGDVLGVEIVYRLAGRATRLMTAVRPGQEFDIIGPLGRGYRRDPSKRVHILVGGGSGVASLYALGQELSEVAREQKLEPVSVLGFRSRGMVMLEEEFGSLGGELVLATDDGTHGRKGSAVDVLSSIVEARGCADDCVVYASGPEPMNRALVGFCREHGIPGQLAMEKHMLCGIGACLTCTCKVDKTGVLKHRDLTSSHIQLDPRSEIGYALVCRDGPIFDLDEVVLE
ncbi:MAG: dihydroorotate dehydrogenase electron transfer subunit [bacterium]